MRPDDLFLFLQRQYINAIKIEATATEPTTLPAIVPGDFLDSVAPSLELLQFLSSLGVQSLSIPCLTHSWTFSSSPSEQQAEHSWQLWTVLLMKYSFLHFPLHTVSLWLVHSAFFISCSAHWWHALHGEESYSLENVPVLQGRHSIVVGGPTRVLPHSGCNPNPLWHVSQGRQRSTVRVEFTIVYSFLPQIFLLLLGCMTFTENKF